MAPLALDFVTVDVFTVVRYAGNPLAIVKLPPAAAVTQEQKQQIAREFNFSETVFLHAREDKSASEPVWRIDIFTTTAELPFAGHPTIGAASTALAEIADSDPAISNGGDTISGNFITKAGWIKVRYAISSRVAKAAIPHNVHVHQYSFSQTQLLQGQPGLGLPGNFQAELQASFPVVSIVKGMTFVLVELPSEEALGAVRAGQPADEVDLDEEWSDSFVGFYFFVRLADSHDGAKNVRTRMIEGSLEDPATGSAASALSAYLSLQSRQPGRAFQYRITQGVEMGRKSEIGVEVEINREGGIDTITLAGGAVQVTEGRLIAPE